MIPTHLTLHVAHPVPQEAGLRRLQAVGLGAPMQTLSPRAQDLHSSAVQVSCMSLYTLSTQAKFKLLLLLIPDLHQC